MLGFLRVLYGFMIVGMGYVHAAVVQAPAVQAVGSPVSSTSTTPAANIPATGTPVVAQPTVVMPASVVQPQQSAAPAATVTSVVPLAQQKPATVQPVPALPPSAPVVVTNVSPQTTSAPVKNAIVPVLPQAPTAVVRAAPAPAPAPAITGAPTSPEAKALLAASNPSTPLVSTTGDNKLQQFKMFFAVINSRTAKDDVNKGMKAFQDLVLEPALTLSSLTMDNLEEIKSTISIASATLRLVDPSSAGRFDSYATRLAKRLEKQQAFMNDLAQARKIGDDHLLEKIARYDSTLGMVSSDLVDSVKQSFIMDLGALFNRAKSKGKPELDAIKQLLTKAQRLDGFSASERNQCAQILSGTVAAIATALPAAVDANNGQVAAAVAAKIKELAARTSTLQKCAVLRELVALIGAAASPADKNQVVSAVNTMYTTYGSCNGAELAELQAIFKLMLSNASLLISPQRAVLGDWIKVFEAAKAVAEPARPLIGTVKGILGNMRAAPKRGFKALLCALNLLHTKLPPEELDKNKSSSLISLIRAAIPAAYNMRSMRDPSMLSDIHRIFELANQNEKIKDAIKPEWLENTVFLSKLSALAHEPSVFARIQAYRTLVKEIKPTIDRFEVSVFVDALTTLNANRYERAQLELEQLIGLLDDCLAPVLSKTFTPRDLALFQGWKKPLLMLVGLLNVQQHDKLSTKLALLKNMLPALAERGAARERGVFINTLNTLFMRRGNLTAQELGDFIAFLQEIKKPQNASPVGAPSQDANVAAPQKAINKQQEGIVEQWIKELNYAKEITPAGLAYADALLKKAREGHAVPPYRKLLDLFVDAQTATLARVNGYVDGLNSLIKQRSGKQGKPLKDLLQRLQGKRVGSNFLLSDDQRAVVRQWLGVV